MSLIKGFNLFRKAWPPLLNGAEQNSDGCRLSGYRQSSARVVLRVASGRGGTVWGTLSEMRTLFEGTFPAAKFLAFCSGFVIAGPDVLLHLDV